MGNMTDYKRHMGEAWPIIKQGGNLFTADTELQTAVEAAPDSGRKARALINRAVVQLLMKQWDKARVCLRQADTLVTPSSAEKAHIEALDCYRFALQNVFNTSLHDADRAIKLLESQRRRVDERLLLDVLVFRCTILWNTDEGSEQRKRATGLAKRLGVRLQFDRDGLPVDYKYDPRHAAWQS